MSKIKTYQDSKDFPFWNYKRVIQTGDFFYLIKGYDSGDEVEADHEDMKLKFNNIVEDYVMTVNAKNEEIVNYGRYLSVTNEINKLSIVIGIIDLKLRGVDIELEEVNSILSMFKIEKNEDLIIQNEILQRKIDKYKNEQGKLKNIIDKSEESNDLNDEIDIDEQFMNVCVGLEMHVDETKISLYQYGMMVKILIKRVEQLNKVNK